MTGHYSSFDIRYEIDRDLTGVPTTTTDPSFPIEGLSTTNNPSGGTVGYFYSADDGATWTAFKPSAGIPVSGTMKIKAKIAAAIGTDNTAYWPGETPAYTIINKHEFNYTASVTVGEGDNKATASVSYTVVNAFFVTYDGNGGTTFGAGEISQDFEGGDFSATDWTQNYYGIAPLCLGEWGSGVFSLFGENGW